MMMRKHSPRSDFLDRRLAQLSRKRAGLDAGTAPAQIKANGHGEAASTAGNDFFDRIGVEDVFPGAELRDPEGEVYLCEQLRSTVEIPNREWGKLERAGRPRMPEEFLVTPEWVEPAWEASYEPDPGMEDVPDPKLPLEVLHSELELLVKRGIGRAVFLDLETCGLTQACVFLAGTMQWNGEDFVLRQYLARNYAEERPLVLQLNRYLQEFDTLITFNGKSFDIPMLRDRATVFGLDLRIPEHHVDLLHHARARWRGLIPNCRLITLESYICGRRRSGDIPGAEIPGLYHHFVKRGDPYRLVPVLHHNLLDVITMEDLLRTIVQTHVP